MLMVLNGWTKFNSDSAVVQAKLLQQHALADFLIWCPSLSEEGI
jgi:hypothetical protein